MNIIKSTTLSADKLQELNEFICNCNYNSGICFLDNDMNYYEDFPCFYQVYDKDILIAFLSIFIPDSSQCEIYFHVSKSHTNICVQLFNELYSDIKNELDYFKINNAYILFENTAIPDIPMKFSHSECLMYYDLSHNFSFIGDKLEYQCENVDSNIIINTFFKNKYVGSCQIEVSMNYALIHDVEVLPEYRGLGYGKETLFHTINHLKNKGYTDILLHVNSANTIAFAMYSHYGFKIKQKIDNYLLT